MLAGLPPLCGLFLRFLLWFFSCSQTLSSCCFYESLFPQVLLRDLWFQRASPVFIKLLTPSSRASPRYRKSRAVAVELCSSAAMVGECRTFQNAHNVARFRSRYEGSNDSNRARDHTDCRFWLGRKNYEYNRSKSNEPVPAIRRHNTCRVPADSFFSYSFCIVDI